MRAVFTLNILLFQILYLHGQELTIQSRQADANYKTHDRFADCLYGEAAFQAGLYQEGSRPISDMFYKEFRKDAELVEVISLLRLETPESEMKAVVFIKSFAPDPVINPAAAALGSYYYNKRWYKKAIEAYRWGDPEQLPVFDKGEYYFKLGYSQFVTKDFQAAQQSLEKAQQTEDAYYEASIYYVGLCEYFLGRYPAAVAHLQKVKTYADYAPYIPYYLIQIYFSRHEYEKVIEEGESALLNEQLTNRKEISQLTGQAYFRKNLYEKALPHLEYYEKNTQQLTFEEFYQLGMTHYKLGHYTKAAEYFRELQLVLLP
jgi:tetratricopeptide (TPR) repeat protein